MYSLPVRLNTIIAKKYSLQYKRVSRTPLTCLPIYTRKQNLNSFQGTHLQQKIPIVEGHHYERNNYRSTIWTRGLIVFSILLGSAAFGAVKALCQKKKSESDEKNEFVHHSADRKPNLTIEEVRNLDLSTAADLEEAKRKAVVLLSRKMDQVGAPGIAVSVSVNGETVWARGFGFADVENYVPCTSKTVMRIASISKPITMTLLAKLWEEGKVDLDAPVQKYVPYFPTKTVDGEEVTITTRQLISHKSGIRHYQLKEIQEEEKRGKSAKSSNKQNEKKHKEKAEEGKTEHSSEIKVQDDLEKAEDNQSLPQEVQGSKEERENSEKTSEEKTAGKNQGIGGILRKKKMQLRQHLNRIADKPKKKEKSEFSLEEYHFRVKFTGTEDSMKIFMDDELFFKPGTDFLYTTHGWTVVSAVVESVVGKPFTQAIQGLFHDLGLRFTYLDDPSRIIYNRASYYRRDASGRLENAPYVDNSYKWAGGGFLSTAEDLTRFGNAMLYSSQQECAQNVEGQAPERGYLTSSTMKHLWTPVAGTKMGWDRDGGYGWGWGAVEGKENLKFCREVRPYASHTGGAVGASSVLLILPTQSEDGHIDGPPPRGVVVTLLTNMENVGLNTEALEIAKLFEEVSKKPSYP